MRMESVGPITQNATVTVNGYWCYVTSQLNVDTIKGKTTEGSITVQGEGATLTCNKGCKMLQK